MANCSDCYKGCVDGIVSDRCVKYTGVDIPFLNVSNGDSLSYLEQAIVSFIGSLYTGAGIKINIPESEICAIVNSNLPSCENINALNLFRAIVKTVCTINNLVVQANDDINSIQGPYTVSCLTGVDSNSGIKNILQAVIDKLCSVDTTLAALSLDVATNYVKISDINSYIEAYLESNPLSPANRYSLRMVPYSIVPYYGPLTFFDSTGKGLDSSPFKDIYLCNGLNGTPDLRGRVLVGAIDSVPGPTLPSDVNPSSSPFNPNYAIGDAFGSNSITLTLSQIPSHGHTATVNDPQHTHDLSSTPWFFYGSTSVTVSSGSGSSVVSADTSNRSKTGLNSNTTGVTVTIGNSGGGQPHSNIQPVRAVYFIMHIPS